MAPRKLLDDPPVVEDSEEETVNGAEEEEEEEDAVKAADGKANSGDDDDDDEEEEEEEEESEDEDEEDNEEKIEKPSAKKTHVTSSSETVANSHPRSPSASEEDPESGSETESDNTNRSPSASDFTVKPIVSKPMNDAVKPNKKNAPAKSSSSKSGSKRPAETEPKPKDSKKKKVMNGGDDEDAKKGRLWSEDDEIAILKGLIEYQAKKGPVTTANMVPFHEFVKKNLQADVVTAQLGDKIRRLKKKYLDNAKKGENGEDPVFSKPHEFKSFALSKKIWGAEANGVDDNAKGSKRKPPRKSNKGNNSTVLALPVSDVAEKEERNVAANGGVKTDPDDFSSKYPYLSGSLRSNNCSPRSDLSTYIIQGTPLIGNSKLKEWDEKWRALQRIEVELYAKKLALIHEQTILVLDLMNSSKD